MTDIQQFDFNVDLMRALLWQYEEAKNLRTLLQEKSVWYDENQRQFWLDWYVNIFDLRTANAFGLKVWSIILGQPLVIFRSTDDRPTWGYEEFHRNFTRGNFGASNGAIYPLGTEGARILLRLRYYQLIGSGTIPEMNRLLKDVFADYGPVFVNDNHNMTQMITFGFPLTAEMKMIFNYFDILPRPAGVGSEYRVIVNESWGFDQFHENFDNGNFSEG